MKRRLVFLALALVTAAALCGCGPQEKEVTAKPVIYLYPEEETAVTVTLDYDGQLTTTYPAYDGGWSVTAEPDGTLYDQQGREYSYLSGRASPTRSTIFPKASASPAETARNFCAAPWKSWV